MNTFSDKPIVAEVVDKPEKRRTFETAYVVFVTALAVILVWLIAMLYPFIVDVWTRPRPY